MCAFNYAILFILYILYKEVKNPRRFKIIHLKSCKNIFESKIKNDQRMSKTSKYQQRFNTCFTQRNEGVKSYISALQQDFTIFNNTINNIFKTAYIQQTIFEENSQYFLILFFHKSILYFY